MPEGPTLLLLREEAERFAGRKVLEVGGNSRLPDLQRMKGKTVKAVRTWGKHFLMEFRGFSCASLALRVGCSKATIGHLRSGYTSGVRSKRWSDAS